MYWHIESDILSLIAASLLLVYQFRLTPRPEERRRARDFRVCVWICVCVTAVDIAASLVMDYPTNRWLYHALMGLYLISVLLVILGWLSYSLSILYADAPRRGRLVLALSIAPYFAYVAAVLTNPWTALFFSLGEHMEYERGPLFFLMLALFAAYTLELAALTLVRRRHISPRYSARVLLSIPCILAVSIYVQLANAGWLVILPAYTICLLMAFLFLQSREQSERDELMHSLSIEASTDKLTGALNRAGAESQIRRAVVTGGQPHCLMAVVDVNDLKRLNDSLGHEGGDRALITVARRLRSHFRASDIVARYGGDEFVVCLFGRFTAEQIRGWLDRLSQDLTDAPIEGIETRSVGASIGAAWGPVEPEAPEALLQRADAELYQVKRNGKRGYSLAEPDADASKSE